MPLPPDSCTARPGPVKARRSAQNIVHIFYDFMNLLRRRVHASAASTCSAPRTSNKLAVRQASRRSGQQARHSTLVIVGKLFDSARGAQHSASLTAGASSAAAQCRSVPRLSGSLLAGCMRVATALYSSKSTSLACTAVNAGGGRFAAGAHAAQVTATPGHCCSHSNPQLSAAA